jgi:hypothetical protein
MPSCAYTSFDDPDQFSAAVRAAEVKLTVTRRGGSHATLMRADLHALWLQEGQESFSRVAHVGLTPTRVITMFTQSGGAPLQADFISGKTDKSARDHFFYYSGAQLAAVRWKDWKFMYYGSSPGAEGWVEPLIPYHFTLLTNLARDPFEQSQGNKSFNSFGGALAGPVTSYLYDWNILPIGQMLALEHLETYEKYPPMQAPASWNLSQVMEEINKQKRTHATKPAGSGD